MKVSALHLACSLLLCVLYWGCNQCKNEGGQYYALRGYGIPYQEGDVFQMQDSTGRIVQFQDTLFEDFNQGGEPSCECCDPSVAQSIRTEIASDSAGISLRLQETAIGSEDATAPDVFSIYIGTGSFSARVYGTTFTAGYGTQLTAHSSIVIRGTTYTNVYELDNGATLPTVVANKIWYNASLGLLRVEFTDGGYLER